MDSLVVQTAIGLVFVFATFAALVSVLTEAIARYIGLRGEYLLRGIRSLLDERRPTFELPMKVLLPFKRPAQPKQPEQPAQPEQPEQPAPAAAVPAPTTDSSPISVRLVNESIIAHTADKAQMPANAGNTKLTNDQRRKLPSYISGRSFAGALIGLLVPDETGTTNLVALRTRVNDLPEPKLRAALLSMLTAAGDDIEKFRHQIEQWYDDHMARVSGWYKRHVRWVSLAIGLVLVLFFNLNAVDIARSLYTDQALRTSVVAEAAEAAKCTDNTAPKTPAECLQEMRQQIQQVRGAGLPIGWGTVPECAPSSCGFMAAHGLADPTGGPRSDLATFLLVLVGWALMVIALLPGARFWFDALGRLGSLRSTGPKPAPSVSK